MPFVRVSNFSRKYLESLYYKDFWTEAERNRIATGAEKDFHRVAMTPRGQRNRPGTRFG
jgi:hypothetical protein